MTLKLMPKSSQTTRDASPTPEVVTQSDGMQQAPRDKVGLLSDSVGGARRSQCPFMSSLSSITGASLVDRLSPTITQLNRMVCLNASALLGAFLFPYPSVSPSNSTLLYINLDSHITHMTQMIETEIRVHYIGKLTRRSAVTEKPRDAPRDWKFFVKLIILLTELPPVRCTVYSKAQIPLYDFP